MGGDRERDIRNRKKEDEQKESEYEIEDVSDAIDSYRGSGFNHIENELGLEAGARRKFSRDSVINGIRYVSRGLFIHPESR